MITLFHFSLLISKSFPILQPKTFINFPNFDFSISSIARPEILFITPNNAKTAWNFEFLAPKTAPPAAVLY